MTLESYARREGWALTDVFDYEEPYRGAYDISDYGYGGGYWS